MSWKISKARRGSHRPSWTFTKNGERVVGDARQTQAVTNARNTIYSIKRFMGRKFREVEEEAKRMPNKVVEAANRRRPR